MSGSLQRGRLGQPRKLYSAKGTLLGIIHYPLHWDEAIQERGGIHVALPIKLTWRDVVGPPSEEWAVRTMSIFRSYHARDGVEIEGVTLEQFEELEGCAFTPSAGYLRSLLADE